MLFVLVYAITLFAHVVMLVITSVQWVNLDIQKSNVPENLQRRTRWGTVRTIYSRTGHGFSTELSRISGAKWELFFLNVPPKQQLPRRNNCQLRREAPTQLSKWHCVEEDEAQIIKFQATEPPLFRKHCCLNHTATKEMSCFLMWPPISSKRPGGLLQPGGAVDTI